MADQDLRLALEALAADWRYNGGRKASEQLLELLVAHPAEPAPLEISEAEAEAYQEQLDDVAWPSALSAYERGENPCPVLDPDGLAASAPLPSHTAAPQPAPVGAEITDEAVKAAWVAAGHTTLHGDRVAQIRAALEAARPFMTSRPALDRDQVDTAVRRNLPVDLLGDSVGETAVDLITDAVLALAVPVPTEDDIVGELSVEIGYVAAQTAARAVLALLNGLTHTGGTNCG